MTILYYQGINNENCIATLTCGFALMPCHGLPLYLAMGRPDALPWIGRPQGQDYRFKKTRFLSPDILRIEVLRENGHELRYAGVNMDKTGLQNTKQMLRQCSKAPLKWNAVNFGRRYPYFPR